MISLNKLDADKSAKVLSIDAGINLKDRLYDLGIKEGIVIKKITAASTRGTVVIKLGRGQIALGSGMASKIIVEPV